MQRKISQYIWFVVILSSLGLTSRSKQEQQEQHVLTQEQARIQAFADFAKNWADQGGISLSRWLTEHAKNAVNDAILRKAGLLTEKGYIDIEAMFDASRIMQDTYNRYKKFVQEFQQSAVSKEQDHTGDTKALPTSKLRLLDAWVKSRRKRANESFDSWFKDHALDVARSALPGKKSGPKQRQLPQLTPEMMRQVVAFAEERLAFLDSLKTFSDALTENFEELVAKQRVMKLENTYSNKRLEQINKLFNSHKDVILTSQDLKTLIGKLQEGFAAQFSNYTQVDGRPFLMFDDLRYIINRAKLALAAAPRPKHGAIKQWDAEKEGRIRTWLGHMKEVAFAGERYVKEASPGSRMFEILNDAVVNRIDDFNPEINVIRDVIGMLRIEYQDKDVHKVATEKICRDFKHYYRTLKPDGTLMPKHMSVAIQISQRMASPVQALMKDAKPTFQGVVDKVNKAQDMLNIAYEAYQDSPKLQKWLRKAVDMSVDPKSPWKLKGPRHIAHTIRNNFLYRVDLEKFGKKMAELAEKNDKQWVKEQAKKSLQSMQKGYIHLKLVADAIDVLERNEELAYFATNNEKKDFVHVFKNAFSEILSLNVRSGSTRAHFMYRFPEKVDCFN